MFKKINWTNALSLVGLVGWGIDCLNKFIGGKVAEESEEELVERIANKTSEKVIEKIEKMKSV